MKIYLVDTGRKINGKALDSDIWLTPADVSAAPAYQVGELETRLNTIFSELNNPGSTDSYHLEIADARVGFGGTQHTSVGDNIRAIGEQIDGLKNKTTLLWSNTSPNSTYVMGSETLFLDNNQVPHGILGVFSPHNLTFNEVIYAYFRDVNDISGLSNPTTRVFAYTGYMGEGTPCYRDITVNIYSNSVNIMIGQGYYIQDMGYGMRNAMQSDSVLIPLAFYGIE